MAIMKMSVDECVSKGERFVYNFLAKYLPEDYKVYSNVLLLNSGTDSMGAEDELDFNQPVDEEGDLQAADEKPQKNEALSAIRTLAMTKGLTNEIMLDSEADEAIEKFAGLPLTEENLTKAPS